MKYSHFEQLVIGVGAVAVIATMIAALQAGALIEEMAAQALVLLVLVAAAHYGRNGGFVAALLAVLIYVLMRAPSVAQQGLTPVIAELILIRTLTYGVVGILGGELCGRVKYLFARLESAANVDDCTSVYNQRFVARLIQNEVAANARYGAPFSVVVMTLSPALFAELRASKQASIVKSVADHLRNAVRLVDDVARLDDGRFVLVLPHTPKAGGHIAAERVRGSVRDLLGAKDESVTTEVWGAPEDVQAITYFAGKLSPAGDVSPAAA